MSLSSPRLRSLRRSQELTWGISSLTERSSQSSATRPGNGSRSAAAPKASTSSSIRSSGRQVKLATQGFNFGNAAAGQRDQRDVEKAEKELVRERRRKEQRIEELEVRF